MSLMQRAGCYSLYKKGKLTKEMYDKGIAKIAYNERLAGIYSIDTPLVNIASNVHDTTWFIDDRVQSNKVSAAEQIINSILAQYNVEWHSEVSFKGLQLPTGGYARFDYWFPAYKLIIEYDGKLHHSSPEQQAKDSLKNMWCALNNIAIKRYNASHYYHMDREIGKLMSKYGVKRKRP